MLLSGSEIEEEVSRGRIRIEPFASTLVRSASYTLRLADRWIRWKRSQEPIRVWSRDALRGYLDAPEQTPSIILQPGDFVLGSTMENIQLPDDLAGIVCTLSHLARFGVSTTAGSLLVRPRFGADAPKALTLELHSANPSPLELTRGMPVCHLAFIRTSSSSTEASRSVYERNSVPSPPMLYQDMAGVIAALASREEK